MANVEIIDISVGSDDLHFQQGATLDGEDFTLDFEWNESDQHWFFSLYDADNAPVVTGWRLVNNTRPLKRVTALNAPKGQLVLISDTKTDPAFGSLGVNSQLAYIPLEVLVERLSTV